jgi:hypothetical protein
VGGKVICSSYFGDSAISCHDNDWGLIAFKGSVEEREAFNVKHMDLVNEKNTRHNLSSSFFSPFSDFLVNLLTDFRFYFSNITSE